MHVQFSSGAGGAGMATYTTDEHERGGIARRRVVTVARQFTYTPLLRREVVEYRITHVEHIASAAPRVLLDGGVSTFAAALDVLGRELDRLIADGFARKADLERVPSVPTSRHQGRPRAGRMTAGQYPSV